MAVEGHHEHQQQHAYGADNRPDQGPVGRLRPQDGGGGAVAAGEAAAGQRGRRRYVDKNQVGHCAAVARLVKGVEPDVVVPPVVLEIDLLKVD